MYFACSGENIGVTLPTGPLNAVPIIVTDSVVPNELVS